MQIRRVYLRSEREEESTTLGLNNKILFDKKKKQHHHHLNPRHSRSLYNFEKSFTSHKFTLTPLSIDLVDEYE